MAQKVQVVLVDDIDGGPADETVSFALDGNFYEIDVSNGNARRLRDALSSYIGHARKAPRQGRRSGTRRPAGRGRNAEIRSWAKSQGISVNERGRIPGDIVRRYDATH